MLATAGSACSPVCRQAMLRGQVQMADMLDCTLDGLQSAGMLEVR